MGESHALTRAAEPSSLGVRAAHGKVDMHIAHAAWQHVGKHTRTKHAAPARHPHIPHSTPQGTVLLGQIPDIL